VETAGKETGSFSLSNPMQDHAAVCHASIHIWIDRAGLRRGFALGWGFGEKTQQMQRAGRRKTAHAAEMGVEGLGMRLENALFPNAHRPYRHPAKSFFESFF